MVYNRMLGKKEICEAMLGHTAVQFGLSSLLRNMGKKYGPIYIKLFGYPFSTGNRILARKTLKILKGDKKGLLLDVGCSHGAFDFELARRGYKVVGVDINKESIGVGDKIRDSLRVKNLTFHNMDILSNDFPEKKIDVIIMFEALEHIKEDDRVIREFRRILKDDGTVILSVPYAETVDEYDEPLGACMTKEGGCVCVGEGGSHYRNGYNLDRMKTLLERNGFTIVKWEYLCFPRWLESSLLSFPFKFPLSLLFTHFSQNRLKLAVIAKKVASHRASVDKESGHF
ncbi:MAG TPA: methyltransferase domain-containing protein [Thermodesulfobacteriota bacterium]|nr:methyltransferase domain-containing protein [Thermodesulfobacteriota bacterium]